MNSTPQKSLAPTRQSPGSGSNGIIPRAPGWRMAVLAIVCMAALSACGTKDREFPGHNKDQVWKAMVQAADDPRYSDWIVVENQVWRDDLNSRIEILRNVRRDVTVAGEAPRREEAEWRFSAELLDTTPPSVEFSTSTIAVPGHFWLQAWHYLDEVELRLQGMPLEKKAEAAKFTAYQSKNLPVRSTPFPVVDSTAKDVEAPPVIATAKEQPPAQTTDVQLNPAATAPSTAQPVEEPKPTAPVESAAQPVEESKPTAPVETAAQPIDQQEPVVPAEPRSEPALIPEPVNIVPAKARSKTIEVSKPSSAPRAGEKMIPIRGPKIDPAPSIQQAPVPAPVSTPVAAPEQKPAQAPSPAPEQKPAPKPALEPAPASEPDPDPEPAHAPEPAPAFEPAPNPEPVPANKSEPVPPPAPAPSPAQAPAPEPVEPTPFEPPPDP